MTRPLRARRSELSVPATSEKMMAKAAAGDADLVFLDLEDAVAPNAKASARAGAVRALRGLDWGTKTRAVRINGVHTHWCLDDVVDVVTGAGDALDVLIVPKVKAPRDVWFVDSLLTQLERKLGLEAGRIGLELLIEEVEALARVDEIAACCPRIEALILGVGDLAASHGMRGAHIGTSTAYPGDIWHSARTRMIVAARVNGLDAIDGPFGEFRDTTAYTEQATWAAELGAVGKWAIHPNQIRPANEVFSPTAADVEKARKVVHTMRAAEEAGEGAVAVDGMMVDAATARIFEVVLERARLIGALPEEPQPDESQPDGSQPVGTQPVGVLP
ncbi:MULTISPECIES: HpcH/HpaI aldolase/citrate lyase family protein [Pseudonocardia]|uniref:Citrate lyase subunit beta n=1 Tax=Pseudonocardia saturnea TaxID=33909 RepID=A0ABQ0RVI3_9PSEU|nr:MULTISPECIES: CoA ester lyase [Pseudonocardia]BBG02621.1 citrate lyase subunit beta [Pseudonocardia autotrophica]GEC24680.1 citrate lyase subunit beta [Pseudonocardia saturnea]